MLVSPSSLQAVGFLLAYALPVILVAGAHQKDPNFRKIDLVNF